MKIVSIESPFSGNERRNILYAQAAMRDSLRRGEAPLASHLLYTQVLRDTNPQHRRWGLDASHWWRRHCDVFAFYVDFGESPGMREAEWLGRQLEIPLEYRQLRKEELDIVNATANASRDLWPLLLDWPSDDEVIE